MIDKKGMLKTEMVIQHIKGLVKEGKLGLNSQMPSINQMSQKFGMANETVVKAYSKLKEQGIITSHRGKGFFIAKTDFVEKRNVFVLFDAFTAYKETLFNSMLKEFGDEASIDLYFHHFNIKLFESLIKEAVGKYTDYIILPFYNKKVIPALKILPKKHLYIIDCFLDNFPCQGVFQDFKNDVYKALSSIPFPHDKYEKFNFVYQGEYDYVVAGIASGFKKFCESNGIEYSLNEGLTCPEIEKANAYLALEDENLVELVLRAREKKLKPGKDIGIISYNDTALKKIAEGGVSVISTDFAKMGRDVAAMILNHKNDCINNPVVFIDRGSY